MAGHSLIPGLIILSAISLPEILNQSREKFASFLTPMELYKIKENK